MRHLIAMPVTVSSKPSSGRPAVTSTGSDRVVQIVVSAGGKYCSLSSIISATTPLRKPTQATRSGDENDPDNEGRHAHSLGRARGPLTM
ncbi:hypothetical protein E2C01_072348 [Portunus trituberculatus]|uniref:Uncharacterized protein n=1 Tax=Portunus trituberculatus TaxID=210409 RepID=A0A5B7I7I3_PORTR|nr:hypothetical protein [Portunus trituberculatus]